MTNPPPPPPSPDNRYAYQQMPDGSWLATPAGQQPPPPPPPKPVNSRLAFWTSTPGIFSMLAIMAGVIVLIAGIGNRVSGPNFGATVTSCKASGSTATVGLSVKNLSKQTRTARVKVEYRDGAGNRLDTDTAYVRNIAPGDTALAEETTLLDAEPSASTRCLIVDVS